jgi:hypothetical protein
MPLITIERLQEQGSLVSGERYSHKTNAQDRITIRGCYRFSRKPLGERQICINFVHFRLERTDAFKR